MQTLHPVAAPLETSAASLDRPAATAAPQEAPLPVARVRAPWTPGALLLASVLAFALTFVVMVGANSPVPGVPGFLIAAVFAVTAGYRTIQGLQSGQGDVGPKVVVLLMSVVMTGLGALAAFVSTFSFSRGRQLRRFGKILLPPVEAGAAWAEATEEVAVPEELRAELAAQWRENGRTEHASVAAFARLTLDLMALGAPPSLVASANRDALDEIRHTELCFSLARSLDGRADSPGPFKEAQRARALPSTRTLALAKLAVDSLVDGALHEGVSARVIAKLAKRCEVPMIRSILKEIAADEGRHAAHGWDVVDFCLAEGGDAVAHALRGAVRALPASMASPLPEGAREGGWERYGLHGSALEAEEYQKARAEVLRRVAAMTGAELAAA